MKSIGSLIADWKQNVGWSTAGCDPDRNSRREVKIDWDLEHLQSGLMFGIRGDFRISVRHVRDYKWAVCVHRDSEVVFRADVGGPHEARDFAEEQLYWYGP